MTWFKVDDSFHSNPKVLAASPGALGLWVVAGSWSAQNLTEGHVPSHVLTRLMQRADKFATELVRVGLWFRTENGFQFNDWTDYNPTRSEALAVKERQSSGGSIGNHRRWHEAKGKVDPACRYCRDSGRTTDRYTDRSTDQSTESVASRPSRPDPSTTKNTPPPTAGPPKGGQRGGRLPDDFHVTEEMAAWAREKAPLCGIEDHEAFCDYWRSVPGQKGRKLDWVKTWRNWMRREQERRARARPAGRGGAPPGTSTADQRVAQAQALKHELGLTGTDGPGLNLIRGELE